MGSLSRAPAAAMPRSLPSPRAMPYTRHVGHAALPPSRTFRARYAPRTAIAACYRSFISSRTRLFTLRALRLPLHLLYRGGVPAQLLAQLNTCRRYLTDDITRIAHTCLYYGPSTLQRLYILTRGQGISREDFISTGYVSSPTTRNSPPLYRIALSSLTHIRCGYRFVTTLHAALAYADNAARLTAFCGNA